MENEKNEQKKLSLEIEQIQQELKLAPWRIILTFSSIFIVILGFGFERFKTASDRNWIAQNELKHKELSRMAEIASSYDEVFTKTLDKLHVTLSRHVVMSVSFEALKELVEDSELSKKDKDIILSEFKKALNLFHDEKITLNEYTEIIALHGIWETRRTGIAPDDFLYFSDNVLSKWIPLVDAAKEALNENFNVFVGGRSDDSISKFMKLGRELQSAMREEIKKKS